MRVQGAPFEATKPHMCYVQRESGCTDSPMDSRLLAEVRQRNRVHPRLPPRQLHSGTTPAHLKHPPPNTACRLLTWQLLCDGLTAWQHPNSPPRGPRASQVSQLQAAMMGGTVACTDEDLHASRMMPASKRDPMNLGQLPCTDKGLDTNVALLWQQCC